MEISEIFYSIQGEGPQVGMPAWFIRTCGCNLTCEYCDSKYAWKNGKEMHINNIKKKVCENGCKNVIITGGEPLLQEDLLPLIKSLGDRKVYVETNGTIFDSSIIGFATFIVSPKPQFLNPNYLNVLKKWSQHATFKFVIDDKIDFDRAVRLCGELHKKDDIYFMPQGTKSEDLTKTMKRMVKWIKEDAPFVKITPRLQIQLYGNKRGK